MWGLVIVRVKGVARGDLSHEFSVWSRAFSASVFNKEHFFAAAEAQLPLCFFFCQNHNVCRWSTFNLAVTLTCIKPCVIFDVIWCLDMSLFIYLFFDTAKIKSDRICALCSC